MYIYDDCLYIPDVVMNRMNNKRVLNMMADKVKEMNEDREISLNDRCLIFKVWENWNKKPSDATDDSEEDREIEMIIYLLNLSYLFSLINTKQGMIFLESRKKLASSLKHFINNLFIFVDYDMCRYFRKKLDIIKTNIEDDIISELPPNLKMEVQMISQSTQTDDLE
jgi:hypothetical protein